MAKPRSTYSKIYLNGTNNNKIYVCLSTLELQKQKCVDNDESLANNRVFMIFKIKLKPKSNQQLSFVFTKLAP